MNTPGSSRGAYTSPGRDGGSNGFSQCPSPRTSPRKAGERLAVFIPCPKSVWLSATCDAASVCDEDGNIEFLVDDPSLGEGVIERRLLKVDIRSLPLHNLNVGHNGVEDMCDLGFLHEASILNNLQRRFENKLPYTRSGDICIAVNPYQWLDIYTQSSMQSYSKKLRHELPPHVFATSAEAYRGLRDRNRNQSILVSGESGAGKTETVKIMLNMLAHVATPASAGASSETPSSSIVQKIISANPLLESFGNAKTARNDNSSRFGKFTELQFERSSSAPLVGSKCTTYLLEKSRVVIQNDLHERNYHVFYQLLAHKAQRPRVSESPKLSPKNFKYMNLGDLKTNSIEGKSDTEHYQITLNALKLLGVSSELCYKMEDILMGILHFGEYEFERHGQDELRVSPQDKHLHHERLIEMFGLQDDIDAFHSEITTRTVKAEGKSIAVPLSPEQAYTGKDALAKEIYARLFQWLVLVINFTTSKSLDVGCTAAAGSGEDEEDMSSGFGSTSLPVSRTPQPPAACGTIALLDIFGFESFKINRFEQLCINYANEKLQQKFCLDCFRTVQQEYRDEGLEWEAIPFHDNCDTLFMLEGGDGSGNSIVGILNEECMLGARGSDEAFLSKIKNAFGGGRGNAVANKAFSLNVKTSDSFTVHHYAGRVEYNVSLFVEKNRDAFPLEVHAVLARCRNPLLATLFGPNGHFFAGSLTHDLLNQLDRVSIASVLLLHGDVIPEKGESVTAAAAAVPRMRPAALQPRMKPTTNLRRQSFLTAETVTSKFKSQLAQLLDTLGKTQCQYVRCIKPNVNKSAKEYNLPMVVSQLRSAGMIEAIRISRAAFPYRTTHEEFLVRFKSLRSESWLASQGVDTRSQAGALLLDILRRDPIPMEDDYLHVLSSHVTPNNGKGTNLWELGLSKLYFTSGILEHLESLRSTLVHNTICRVQAIYRGSRARNHYRTLRMTTIRVQAYMRCALAVRFFQNCRGMVGKVQAVYRGWKSRTFSHTLRLNRAACKIASAYRMSSQHRYYTRTLLPACRLIQRRLRMRYVKKTYVLLRDKARHKADLTNRLTTQADEIAFLRQDNARICAENAELRLALDMATQISSEKMCIPMIDASTESIKTETSHAYTNTSPRPLETNIGVSTFTQTDMSSVPVIEVEAHSSQHEQLTALREAFERETQNDRKHAAALVKDAEALMCRAEEAAKTAGISLTESSTSPPVKDITPSTPLAEVPIKAALNSDSKIVSPSPRIHKQDVKDMLRLMEAGAGLSCTIYAVQKKGGSLVGKPAVLKKRADGAYEGGGRIDCEVRTPMQPSANGYTGVTGSTPKKNSSGPVTAYHPAAAPSIKVLRFGVADVLQVRRGRCGLIQLPRAVSDGLCLVVTVRDKGELNFVLDSKARCEIAYVAFHYLMQRCGSNPKHSPSPVRSPMPTIRHTPGRGKGLNIATDGLISPTRSISFRSPLMERAQEHGRGSVSSGSASTGKQIMPPAPPVLPYGTPLHSSSPFKDKENTPRTSEHGSNLRHSDKDGLSFTDTGVRKALRQADDIIASETQKVLSISKRGWVTKADSLVAGLSTPHWQRRFCMLERESRLLKFSQSELAEHYPSQVRSMVSLHPSTTTLKVVKGGGGSSGITSYFSGGNHLLEIHNSSTASAGEDTVLKLQFESMDELGGWVNAIEDVIAGVR